jgi:hypothetical protein
MQFGLSSKRCFTMLTAMAAAGMALATARAGEHGEAIQFSSPSSPVGTSNLSSSLSAGLERLNPTPSSFKQAQDDLFRPLAKTMNPQDSMQGVLSVPLPGSPQLQIGPDKRTLELMDRRRNWAFTDLKDLYPEPTVEDMLGVKDYDLDGKDKKAISAIEKYYENLGQKPDQKGDSIIGNFNGTGNGQFSSMGAFNPVVPGFPGSDPFANKRITASGKAEEESDRNMVVTEDPAVIAASLQEAAAAQKRTDEFKRLLDPSLPPAKPARMPGSGISMDDFMRGPSALQNNNSVFNNAVLKQTDEPRRSVLYSTLGFVDPTTTALHVRALDDPTASMLGMPNPIKAAPAPKPAETIKQMLDPFAAGMMKPKF